MSLRVRDGFQDAEEFIFVMSVPIILEDSGKLFGYEGVGVMPTPSLFVLQHSYIMIF